MISKRLKILSILTIMNIFAVTVLIFQNIISTINNYFPETYKLDVLEEKGYIGATIQYDKEPVGVSLLSPSGKEISVKNMSLFDDDPNTKKMTVMYDTSETGEWKIKLTKKSNKRITFESLQDLSPTIHIKDFKLTDIGSSIYATFVPTMAARKVKTCEYTILLRNEKKSFALPSGSVMLNKKAYVPIKPDENAFTGDAYDLTIVVTSSDKDFPSSDMKNIEVVLPKKTISVNKIDLEETENGD